MTTNNDEAKTFTMGFCLDCHRNPAPHQPGHSAGVFGHVVNVEPGANHSCDTARRIDCFVANRVRGRTSVGDAVAAGQETERRGEVASRPDAAFNLRPAFYTHVDSCSARRSSLRVVEPPLL
jgi:hypothetical protein